MKRLLFSVMGLAIVGIVAPEAQAQNGSDPGIPKVDFRVGQLRVSDNRLAVQITNAGFAASPVTSLHIGVTDDPPRNKLFSKVVKVRPLQANQTRTMVISGMPAGRRMTITASVDPYKRVPELNEGNNTGSLRSGPLAAIGPDLSILKTEVFSSNVRVTVRNNGPGAMPRPVTVSLNASFGFKPFASQTKTLQRLNQGGRHIFVFNLGQDMFTGSVVTVKVDAANQIQERNEQNNSMTRNYTPGRP